MRKIKILGCLILIFLVHSISYGQLENIKSKLEIYDLEKAERVILYQENNHFEAPNWSKDGNFLILNSRGKLFKYHIENKTKTFINTDFANKINNDHGISPDGTRIVISDSSQPNVKSSDADFMFSRIYSLPINGGTPEIITKNAPSFWHGWSPDGKTLIYTALRNEDFDIYSIHVKGGNEIRLTYEKGLDDGPDFSSDGKHIYFNSFQTGKMEIWKMRTDGSQKEQLTNDQYSNWFPHPSPNGKHLVYLSYLEDQGDRHPGMKNVALKLFDLQNNTIKTLCYFTGGQGTINVPSWSPEGNKFAFVSYELNKNEQ